MPQISVCYRPNLQSNLHLQIYLVLPMDFNKYHLRLLENSALAPNGSCTVWLGLGLSLTLTLGLGLGLGLTLGLELGLTLTLTVWKLEHKEI